MLRLQGARPIQGDALQPRLPGRDGDLRLDLSPPGLVFPGSRRRAIRGEPWCLRRLSETQHLFKHVFDKTKDHRLNMMSLTTAMAHLGWHTSNRMIFVAWTSAVMKWWGV